MSDLYERLLELTGPVEVALDAGGASAALRAVLELHKPFQFGRVMTACRACSVPRDEAETSWRALQDYPCPTVRAIARALDVPIGDQQ